jgi:hypothetical protein
VLLFGFLEIAEIATYEAIVSFDEGVDKSRKSPCRNNPLNIKK